MPPGPMSVCCNTGLEGISALLGVIGLLIPGMPGDINCEPTDGLPLTGDKLIMAFSISAALLQRCSRTGERAFITICSKAGVMSGRKLRKGGKEKMLGLLLAAS